MNQFGQLLNEACDETGCKLSALLLKAKVFASRLRGRKFRQWIDTELNGYSETASVPDYRIISHDFCGDFAGPFQMAKSNVPLTIRGLPKEQFDLAEKCHIAQSVSALESLLESDTRMIARVWPFEMVEMLRNTGVGIEGMTLNHVESRFPRASVVSILTTIRSRLVEFLLELRERYPEIDSDHDAVVPLVASEIDAVVEQKVFHNCTFIGKRPANPSRSEDERGKWSDTEQASVPV